MAARLVLSAAGARFLRAFLHRLDPFDPVAFAGTARAWIAIAMAAIDLPALPAARLNPAAASRSE